MKTSDRAVGRELKKSVKAIEQELTIAAKILDWEIGDLWGHVGARLPNGKGIAVRMFRRPERDKKDWLVHFDFSLKKLSGVGTIPREAVIYSEIFKARPDVNAAVHCHASMEEDYEKFAARLAPQLKNPPSHFFKSGNIFVTMGAPQTLRHMSANKPRSASNQNFHNR